MAATTLSIDSCSAKDESQFRRTSWVCPWMVDQRSTRGRIEGPGHDKTARPRSRPGYTETCRATPTRGVRGVDESFSPRATSPPTLRLTRPTVDPGSLTLIQNSVPEERCHGLGASGNDELPRRGHRRTVACHRRQRDANDHNNNDCREASAGRLERPAAPATRTMSPARTAREASAARHIMSADATRPLRPLTWFRPGQGTVRCSGSCTSRGRTSHRAPHRGPASASSRGSRAAVPPRPR